MTALAVIIALQALALLGIGLRLSQVRTDAKEADLHRQMVEAQLQQTARELADYMSRTRRIMEDLRNDVKTLESDLEKCTAPGERRLRLERLLSRARTPESREG